jgi:hypothetical protein
MYIRQLYSYSRLLFVIAIFVICSQLFVILIWGIEISPFYNYGMYSEVMTVKNSYPVFEIVQNGKKLRGQDFTPERWDKIILPVQYFTDIHKSNQLYETDIKRLLGKFHISANEKNFLSTCNYQQFEDWYKSYLSDVTNEKTQSLSVNYSTYLVQSNHLIASNAFLPLSQLCH